MGSVARSRLNKREARSSACPVFTPMPPSRLTSPARWPSLIAQRSAERPRTRNGAHRACQPALDLVLRHLCARAEERGVLLDRGADLFGRGGSQLARDEADVVAEGEVFGASLLGGIPERHLDRTRLAF